MRYRSIEEAKRAVQLMNRIQISADGNKLVVRPGLTKQQKIGQPIMCGQNNTSTKKQPANASAKPVVTRTIKKVAHKVDSDEDDNNVWDDGLLPRKNLCNGNHDSKGVVNGVAGLDLSNDGSSTTILREMFVAEVYVCLCILL